MIVLRQAKLARDLLRAVNVRVVAEDQLVRGSGDAIP